MRHHLTTATALAVLATTVVTAGQPPAARLPVQTSQPAPVFRSNVDVVHLDVSVLDKDRRPVRGLEPADFAVFEDGKPQQITVFHAVDVPDAEPVSVPWVRDVAPDVRSNEGLHERRLFMLLLDDAAIQSAPAIVKSVRDAARGVVDRLGPGDLASVVFTRDNRHSQDYTNDRARLLAAIDKTSVGFRDMSPTVAGGDDLSFMYSVGVLQRAVEVLRDLPDRRKVIVYIGQGLPIDMLVPMATPGLGAGGASAIMVGTRDLRIRTALEDLFRDAARANVNVYTIDACGLRPEDNAPGQVQTCVPGLEVDYLKGIAAATGGHAIADTNDFNPGLTQLFVENSSYYLLGFQSTNPRQDGKHRRLEVRVNRPGVVVRTRSGYETEKPSARAKRQKALEASPLGVALGGVLPKTDLPIRMTAAALPIPGKRESAVAMVFGIRQPIRVGQGRAIERVDLQVNAFDVEGRAFGSRAYRADVTIRAGASGLAEYEVLSRLDLKPGRYQLRVAANVGSLSTSGSLYYDVDVPDFSAPVSLSGMVLTATPGPEVAPRDALVAVLPVIPTSRRAFTRAHQAAAFLRVHQGGKTPLATVPIRARLVDDKGATVMDNAFEMAPSQFDAQRLANIRIDLAVSRLPPGEYLLTIETPGPQPLGRRQLRFRIDGTQPPN